MIWPQSQAPWTTGQLHVIQEMINSQDYQQITDQNILLSVRGLKLGRNSNSKSIPGKLTRNGFRKRRFKLWNGPVVKVRSTCQMFPDLSEMAKFCKEKRAKSQKADVRHSFVVTENDLLKLWLHSKFCAPLLSTLGCPKHVP